MGDLRQLQQELGCLFRDEELLRLALTHPSVAHEHGAGVKHNQRLEFLGDAVLQLILTRALYEQFPDFGEGQLTKARARLANRRSLSEQSRQLNLGRHLTLSRGEEQQGGRDRPSALADAFEAVVGAIFLDNGFEAAREFVLRRFADQFALIAGTPALENPKGELQEMLQAGSAETPSYNVERASGPDHDRVFECAVYHRGIELGRGTGKSKKDAESQAALAALTRLRAEAAGPG
ncbi:MAG: ribonuclease III [Verrucomicrobiota bacterium]